MSDDFADEEDFFRDVVIPKRVVDLTEEINEALRDILPAGAYLGWEPVNA